MADGFLSRSRIIAPPGWSRWLIPPAALSVHLAIGQAYAWSVFKAPLEKDMGLSGTQSALPFQLAIVMLGLSAAVVGTRVEKNGPRWAMFVSLCCFCGGFLVAALGVATKQYWLVVLRYGGLGGIGLGIGYISPVSTLIKWFPDRPGMATGIAIMGFGGGALIASPWAARVSWHTPPPPRAAPAGHGHPHRDHGLRRRRADRVAVVVVDDRHHADDRQHRDGVPDPRRRL